jgi:hypothetical protein
MKSMIQWHSLQVKQGRFKSEMKSESMNQNQTDLMLIPTVPLFMGSNTGLINYLSAGGLNRD